METFSKICLKTQPFLQVSSFPAHQYHRPSIPRPISSISFRTPSRSLHSRSSISFRIKSSSSSPSANPNSNGPKPKTLINPFPSLFSLFKTPLCITIATAAVFFSRFPHKPLLSLAVSAPTVEKTSTTTNPIDTTDAIPNEEKEKTKEERAASLPDDVQSLKSLMESNLKSRKLLEAIEVVNKLIELQPDETEWKMLRAHMYIYAGESELAKACFEEIIAKDQFKVEAFHGLVMSVYQESEEDSKELAEVMKRIEVAMQNCKKEKRTDDVRDFKLLIAQIRVIEGNYSEALKIYQDLVKEEPRDFRPYLCQGIIYTLLKKKDEAEKYFEKYKRLVPKGHPYADYFDDNVLATKLFSQKAESQGMGADGMKS